MPDQMSKGVSVSKDLTDGGKDHIISYEVPEAVVMQKRQKSRSGEKQDKIRWIDSKLERLGIDQ